MLLVLANYPEGEAQKEGMSQRILAVDEQLKVRDRNYLFISHRKFFKREQVSLETGLVQHRCNIFLHFFFILRLLRQSRTMYIHSVMNVLPWLPLMPFLRKKTQVILDAHGVVPEELTMSGKKMKAALYAHSERWIMRRVNTVIVVTQAMERHFRGKYPKAKADYLVYTILPAHILGDEGFFVEGDGEQTHVVYSGNTQKWQNIELMMSVIHAHRSPQVKYHILTGDIDSMRAHLKRAGLGDDPQVELASVQPHDLKHYYRMAHYGFILRDDVTVNRVACPTKLVEYLHYGIIPIVKQPFIGDFHEMGYEYMPFQDFSASVPATKSMHNQALVKRMIQESSAINMSQLLGKNA